MRTRAYAAGLAGLSLITAVTDAARALDKRADAVQQGDFILIGNSLAQDCGSSTPLPVVGTLDCTGAGNQQDLAPDVFWRAEAGAATASSGIAVEQLQSSATLTIPKGATITHAYLYWAAGNFGMTDNMVTLQCVDQAGEVKDVQAQSNWIGFSGAYNSVADVKEYVQMHGSCSYLVGGVNSAPIGGILPQSFGYALWWMVVLYKDPTAPHRHLMVYDGLDAIGNGGESVVSFTGFQIPKGFELFSTAKLGAIAYDGDASINGDKLYVGDTLLEDAPGNSANFFNSSRSYFGAPLSIAGDLPQLSGEAASMNRIDLDVIDVSTLVAAGQTQIDVKAASDGDLYELAGIALSVPTFTDEDGDGLSDDEEIAIGTSPKDKDSDDDGVEDGKEGCSDLASCPDPAWRDDADKDGLLNALDPDSDNDGLLDGTELGLDCTGADTTLATGQCRADADLGATKTDPLLADTDASGSRDGSEDANLNGMLDSGETDPTAAGAADDVNVMDADTDGLSDALETLLGTGVNDADTDDDGLLDGLEANPTLDTDGDGLTNVLDVDSDNDALYDGTEAGRDCADPATNTKPVAHCIADADPLTTTSPLSNDSDRGGARDASEDWNRNGALDADESDPTLKSDDGTLADMDGDSLSDALETALGSGVDDDDSDDDGVVDTFEPNPGDDTDGDMALNVNDPDSDGDGLFDGTERGNGCADPATDKTKNQCITDADAGQTKTQSLIADTDKGGVPDGGEDFNKNGVYDTEAGEGDPNDKADDVTIKPCSTDADCGKPNSGVVCEDMFKHCIAGCRGVEGSRCPEGYACSSEDSTIGYCIDAGSSSSGEGGAGAGSAAGGAGGDPEDGRGCSCELASTDDSDAAAWLVAMAAGALFTARRRRDRI